MHPFYIGLLLNSLIFFPTIAGIARFRKINKAYHPLIYLAWFTTITIITNTILSYTIRNNTVSFNIHALVEGFLLLWIFKEWKLFNKKELLLKWLISIYIIFWIIYFIGFGLINTFYSHFEIFRHFVLVFLTIHFLNKMISNPGQSLLKDARFYTCLGFMIYFFLNCTTAAFWIFNLEIGTVYTIPLSIIVNATHALYYLILGFSILILPKKQKFLLSQQRYYSSGISKTA